MISMRFGYLAIVIGALLLDPAAAQAADEHRVIPADSITWSEGPASIPPGAEAAVLYGDPGADGVFSLRLKLPAGYDIPPHTHPKPEIVTVISGTLYLGSGSTMDRDKAEPLSPGSFFAFEPGMTHYVFTTEEETVLQLNSVGPWNIEYLDPADDPRTPSQ